MKTCQWIFKWKKNGFLSAKGEAVKNSVPCTSIQLNIRASYTQKIRLQYVKGHSGNVGNDGADAMANRGTLLPVVEESDWDALEMKLTEQLEKSSVDTNGVDPEPMEVEDIDDVEDIVDEIQSESSNFHERESHTTVAVTTSSSIKSTPDSTSWISSSISNKIPLLSATQEKMGVTAASPAQRSVLPASAEF